jgi:hypothetical protein
MLMLKLVLFLTTWSLFTHYNLFCLESIRITLLGGRILFKNLKYTSTNVSVSIVKGHIALQYWLLNVRHTEQEKDGNNNTSERDQKKKSLLIILKFNLI